MQKRVKKGFTLIELLVVIAIIGLLLAIIMPALSKVKELGKRTVCANNLKQQSVACTMYMADNSERFPCKITGYGATNNFGWGGKNGYENGDSLEERLLNPYMGRVAKVTETDNDASVKVFLCPADKGATAAGYNKDRLPKVFDALGSSYFYNAAPGQIEKWGVANRRIGEIRNVPKVILAGCRSFTIYSHYPTYGPEKFMNFFWHNKNEDGWANLLFTDMHVTYVFRTVDDPDWVEGPNWTFVYDLPAYRR